MINHNNKIVRLFSKFSALMKEKEEPLDHMQRITKFSFRRVDIGDCRRGRITEWKRSTAMEKSIYIENCGIEN